MTDSIQSSNYEGPDRRKHRRIPFNSRIHYRKAGSSVFKSTSCVNLSLGGLMFYSPDDFFNGEIFEIHIPHKTAENTISLHLKVRVLWFSQNLDPQSSAKNKWVIGVQFENPSDEEFDKIEKLMLVFHKTDEST